MAGRNVIAPACRRAELPLALPLPLPTLRAFFARRVHANDVDDMVQDVALRLHVRATGETIADGRAYLFQVARSVITDRARRDASRLRAAHEPLTGAHHPVEELSPARVLEGREALALARDTLAAMPERTRRVFLLHRFDRLSHAVIARQLGISVSAVEKHVMKAARLLAARLAY